MTGPVGTRPDRSTPGSRFATVRFLARGYVRLLPGRRGGAAAGLIRDVVSLVSGRGPAPSHAVGDPPVNPATLLRAQRALAAGDLDAAIANAAAVLRRNADSLAALEVRREVEERRGELTSALATIRAMRVVRDTPALERDERMAVGRLLETDRRWAPRIPGPARPIMGPESATVLRVTAGDGGPSSTPAGAIETEGGSEPQDLDPGPVWSAVTPSDEALAVAAWLIARVARERRPALIHAGTGARGYDTLLIGLALRDHLGIPLVVDAPADDATDVPGSEAAARRRATEDRCLTRVDAVVVADDAGAERLESRGVNRDRIAVIEPDSPRVHLAALYAALLAGRVPGRRD
ncbi:MAG: glycosyltransferase [Candidatus Limnocylindrales bacterium]